MSQNILNNFSKLIADFLESNDIRKDISNFDFGNMDIKEITEKLNGFFEDRDKKEVDLEHYQNMKNIKRFHIVKKYSIQTDKTIIWLKKI